MCVIFGPDDLRTRWQWHDVPPTSVIDPEDIDSTYASTHYPLFIFYCYEVSGQVSTGRPCFATPLYWFLTPNWKAMIQSSIRFLHNYCKYLKVDVATGIFIFIFPNVSTGFSFHNQTNDYRSHVWLRLPWKVETLKASQGFAGYWTPALLQQTQHTNISTTTSFNTS